MYHCSTNAVPTTIGRNRGSISDKILHGSDSRQDDAALKNRTHPPSLQDVIFQALTHELVRVILVDGSEIVGKLLWYNNGKFCVRISNESASPVMSCNRVMSISPIDLDEEALPFVTESFRANLLATEEKTSRLQIVRRRVRERNNRLAAAAKYRNSSSV
jgi:hypothetical protein